MHAAIPALNHQIAPGSVWCNHDCRALCVNTNPWYRWATYKNRPNATKQFSTVKYEHMLSKLSNRICFGWNSESVHQLCDLCGGWISTNLFYYIWESLPFLPRFRDSPETQCLFHTVLSAIALQHDSPQISSEILRYLIFFDKKESKTEKTKENRLIINFMKP